MNNSDLYRLSEMKLKVLLSNFPVVAILGPRQVGKTTLAHRLAMDLKPTPLYLDLESPRDIAKLQEPEAYLETQYGRLIILDEIHRVPELFSVLRSVVDRRRLLGEKTGQFLILGSASLDLLKQSSESLAGRIVYEELQGFTVLEIPDAPDTISQLWVRGGFPDSFLAQTDADSLEWRLAFIRTYLERDIPQFGPRIPAETLRRFWTMLAHSQGAQLNMSRFAAGLGYSVPTIQRYLDLLSDLLLVRLVRSWSGNVGKRLVKVPKVYIRDSGLTHALLGISTFDELVGHPVVGGSWEGFVIENICSILPKNASTWYYRTSAGAEIDLVIEIGQKRIAIEIKRSLNPAVSKGFMNASGDIQATHRYVVYPGKETYPLSHMSIATPLKDFLKKYQNI